jgi:hypothetical protein
MTIHHPPMHSYTARTDRRNSEGEPAGPSRSPGFVSIQGWNQGGDGARSTQDDVIAPGPAL